LKSCFFSFFFSLTLPSFLPPPPSLLLLLLPPSSSSSFFFFLAAMNAHNNLQSAIANKDLEKVTAILKADPDLDVSGEDHSHFSLAMRLNLLEIFKLLSSHPATDFNKRNKYGETLLEDVCDGNYNIEMLKLLLKENRVRYPHKKRLSPLYWLCDDERIEKVKWILYLRGREIDNKEVKFLITVSTRQKHNEIASLLKRFKRNRQQVISQLNIELEPPGNPALLFAAPVFLEEGMLKLREKSKKRRKPRFFRMALQLPIEGQMLLCHCVYELRDDYIPNKLSLAAFKKLGTALLSSEEDWALVLSHHKQTPSSNTNVVSVSSF